MDKENEKFTLGVKQLTEDPWTQVPAKYPVGQLINGTVTNITDFGLFVEVEEGIEGLVHVSEISRKKIKSPSEMFKEGDTIEAKVIHVSADERRLGLSIKQTKEEPARGGGKSKSFGGGAAGESTGSTLGDLLREKLEEAAGDALDNPVEEVVEAAPEAVETEAPAEAPAEEAAAPVEESEETK